MWPHGRLVGWLMLGRSVGCLLSRSLARSVAPSLARLSGRTVWLQAGLSCPLHGKPMDIWVPGSTQLSLEQSPELPPAWRVYWYLGSEVDPVSPELSPAWRAAETQSSR